MAPAPRPPQALALGLFLATEDVPRLVAWYRALGVPLADEGHCFVGGAGAPGGGSVFSIMATAAPLPPAPDDAIDEEPYGRRRITVNLRVDDLDAAVAALRARGTRVAGPKDYGYGVFAWARDPDGNVVELWSAAPDPA